MADISHKDIRRELKAHFEQMRYIQQVRWGWPETGNPMQMHMLLDWLNSRVRDTAHNTRRYGFYSRVFLPYQDPHNADMAWADTIEQITDHFESPGNGRMEDGRNWTVTFVNRGGPPIKVPGERQSYRKDFYVEVEVAVRR